MAEFSYGIDNVGNVTSRNSTDTVKFGPNDVFELDNNNRLVKQNVGAGVPNYTYDAANDATLLAGSTNRAKGFGAANQVCWQKTAPATGTCCAVGWCDRVHV